MQRPIGEIWRYARILAILVGMGFGITAFLWVPLSIGLIFWFGGSAITARQYGRSDALVSHLHWTNVSPRVFYSVLASEVLAITSVLTLFVCVLVMWWADWRDSRAARNGGFATLD
jgi:hypothetical protein